MQLSANLSTIYRPIAPISRGQYKSAVRMKVRSFSLCTGTPCYRQRHKELTLRLRKLHFADTMPKQPSSSESRKRHRFTLLAGVRTRLLAHPWRHQILMHVQLNLPQIGKPPLLPATGR